MIIKLINAGSLNVSGKIYRKNIPEVISEEEYEALPMKDLFEIVTEEKEEIASKAIEQSEVIIQNNAIEGVPTLITRDGEDVEIKNNSMNKKGKNKRL